MGGHARSRQPFCRLQVEVRQDGAAAVPENKPLKPDDFPVHTRKTAIVTDAGKPVAEAKDEKIAGDIADRLNSDQAREEDDRWA
jgi:hypothetical protein